MSIRSLAAIATVLSVVGHQPLAPAAECREPCSAPAGGPRNVPVIDPKDLQQVYLKNSEGAIANELVTGAKLTELREGVWWEATFVKQGSRHVQFQFADISAPAGADFRLEVWMDPQGRRLATYEASQFARASTFETDLLPSGNLKLRLVAKAKPAGLVFTWTRTAWQATPGVPLQPESLVARWDPLSTLDVASPPYSLGSRLAMLHIGPTDAVCTGILVDTNTVATNFHCLMYSLRYQLSTDMPKSACSDIRIEFDYRDRDKLGVTTVCERVRRADETLDIALLVIDPERIKIGNTTRQPVIFRPQSEPPPGRLVILHHPTGLPAAIEQNCRVRTIVAGDIFHDCDTTSGSSGSPLFDEQLRLVGIHYKGAYPTNWNGAMVENDLKHNGPRYNQARQASGVSMLLLSQ